MKPRIELLAAIRQRGLRQRDFAKIVNSTDSIVSEVVNGKRNIDESQQAAWARALGREAREIFSEFPEDREHPAGSRR